jgi:hypothetical protein
MTNHERPQIMLSNKRLPDMSWTPRTYGIVFVFCFGQNGYGPCPGSQDLFIMNRHLQPSCRLTCKVVVAFFWVAIIDCFFGFALISAQWKNRCWYLNSFHVREWLTCQAFWYFKICTDPSKPIVVQKRWGKNVLVHWCVFRLCQGLFGGHMLDGELHTMRFQNHDDHMMHMFFCRHSCKYIF